MTDVETARVLSQFARQVGHARQAYLAYMKEGLGTGHEVKFYATVDQRVLGDERFIEDLNRRTEVTRQIDTPKQQVAFSHLLPAVAQVHGLAAAVLVHCGRQRAPSRARAMLVFFGREWSRLSARELGKCLHRDPSMVSRLYGHYAANRDAKTKARLRRHLLHKSIGMPDPQSVRPDPQSVTPNLTLLR